MSGFNDMFDYESHVTLGKEATRYFRILDSIILKWIKNCNIHEYQIPAMIDGEVLKKCGYFNTFPQHLTVAASFKKEVYNEISDNYTNGEYYTISKKFFTPAACLHIYPTLEKEEIKDNRVYTTLARVYRNENNNFEKYTRIWDFSVRELVFVGNNKYVLESLEKIADKTKELLNELGIEAELVPASDNFYPSKKNIVKQRLQKANTLKKEIISVINGREIALCSFNIHNFHFSKTFDFDNDGKVETACVGFGMERWLAALLYNKVDYTMLEHILNDMKY